MDQFGVDPLLLVVESGVQQVPCPVFLCEHGARIPVIAERVEHGGTPASFVEREVVSEVQRAGFK